jgi:hypothetical protein
MKALTDEKIQKRDKVRKESKELTGVTQGSIDEACNSVMSVDP